MNSRINFLILILITFVLASCSSAIINETQKKTIISTLSLLPDLTSIAVFKKDSYIRISATFTENIPVGIGESVIKTYSNAVISNSKIGYKIEQKNDTLLVAEIIKELISNCDIPKSDGIQLEIFHNIKASNDGSIPKDLWNGVNSSYSKNTLLFSTIGAKIFYNDNYLLQKENDDIIKKSERYNNIIYNKSISELCNLIKNKKLSFVIMKN